MKSFVIAGLLALSAHAVPAELEARATTTTCNRDNCFRAVFATSPATRMAAATTDCAKYQTTTVTPCTTTTISTPTVVVSAGTITISFTTLAQRDLCIATTTSGTVPAYASQSCTASGTLSNRFASACSCSGFTSTTVTAPTPTSTITASTTTSTSTSTQTLVLSTPDPSSQCQQRLFTSGPEYTTGGVTFVLSCGVNYQGYNNNIISGPVAQTSYDACADSCAAVSQCNAFDYYNVQIGGTPGGSCFLLKQAVPGTDASSQPNVDTRVDSGMRKVIQVTPS